MGKDEGVLAHRFPRRANSIGGRVCPSYILMEDARNKIWHPGTMTILALGFWCAGCASSRAFIDTPKDDPAQTATIQIHRNSAAFRGSVDVYVIDEDGGFEPNGSLLLDGLYGPAFFQSPDGIKIGTVQYNVPEGGGDYFKRTSEENTVPSDAQRIRWIYFADGRHESDVLPGKPVAVVGVIGTGGTLKLGDERQVWRI